MFKNRELPIIDELDSSVPLSPEKLLFFAVLERAIYDATINPQKTKHCASARSLVEAAKDQAVSWLFREIDCVVSFIEVCEILELDAKKIRRKIKEVLS